MKNTFLAASGIPGSNDFVGVILEVSSEKSKTTDELVNLAKQAVREYAFTDEGVFEWESSGGCFNWGDVANIADTKTFQDICQRIGIHITIGELFLADDILDHDEALMMNCSVKVSDIKWDIDKENCVDLPTEDIVKHINPDSDIAEILEDKYGFSVQSYGNVKIINT